MATRHNVALLLLAACQAPTANQTGFGDSIPEPTTLPASTGSSGPTTSTSEDSGSAADTSAEPPRDVGVLPDFGDGAPIGCKDKIDLLFVISREYSMSYAQEHLLAAFPQFIAALEAKFAELDYHIMVVTGDDGWGIDACTEVCSTPSCKIGEPCCPLTPQDGTKGQPCCYLSDYPCPYLGHVTECDRTWGAGEMFPAGIETRNEPCWIEGDLRYLVTGQATLAGTFECIARVGLSGHGALGQALAAAMQEPINEPGGCNSGFLRDDALLMVTFIASTLDHGETTSSAGTPAEWAQAVLDAKHGDDRSVVMLNIGRHDIGPHEGECHPDDRLCLVSAMFPYRHGEDVMAPDYGPAFAEAAGLVETACAGFVPPG